MINDIFYHYGIKGITTKDRNIYIFLQEHIVDLSSTLDFIALTAICFQQAVSLASYHQFLVCGI